MGQDFMDRTYLECALRKKAIIHQLTTMLATSRCAVPFPGHNHLLTTSTDNQSIGPSVLAVSRWLWRGTRTFLEVTSMVAYVVTWWIVAFCAVLFHIAVRLGQTPVHGLASPINSEKMDIWNKKKFLTRSWHRCTGCQALNSQNMDIWNKKNFLTRSWHRCTGWQARNSENMDFLNKKKFLTRSWHRCTGCQALNSQNMDIWNKKKFLTRSWHRCTGWQARNSENMDFLNNKKFLTRSWAAVHVLASPKVWKHGYIK